MTTDTLRYAITSREHLRRALDGWPDDPDTHRAFTWALAAYDELGAWLKERGAIDTPLPSPVTEPPPEPALEHLHD